MENIRKPQILIQTDGITNTKIFIDGKVSGTCGIDSWKKVIEHVKAKTK